MKRYASIDFMRGLAIFMMLVLHIISDLLDLPALLADMGKLTLLELLLLIVLPFLGGLAGFFLMISSIGNTISMQKQLMRGKSNKDVAKRQVLGGFLLLIFAMLTEGLLGYHGLIGEIFKHLDNLSAIDWTVPLWRGYHFETIHAIAWCVIVNGAVHAYLTRDGKWKDIKKLTKQYIILAVVVLALTPLMWYLADLIVPGYPYDIDDKTGRILMYAEIGKSSIWDVIIRFILAPFAAAWEPIFPYLAASFLGTIIGIYLSQEKKDVDRSYIKKYLKFGLLMFVIGAIGVIINLVWVVLQQGIDPALDVYIDISEHRSWTLEENGVPFLGWLFQFLLLNGFSICGITMVIRSVEFRGRGKKLADQTKFIRRLGFVAFTAYTMQYIYNFAFFIVSSIFTAPYVRMGWGPVMLALGLSLLIYHGLTWLWEKISYVGSMEWMIGTIASYLVPGKRVKGYTWWKRGQLDVQNAFYDAEWIDIIDEDEIDHKRFSESRYAYKIARLGFIFFPFSFMAYRMAKNAVNKEEPNKFQKKAEKLALGGIIFFIVWLVLSISLKLATLGISF